MTPCCYRRNWIPGCGREATQAFDVWSWFQDVRRQTPAHYEVCNKHAFLFEGYTGAWSDSRTMIVRERCVSTPLTTEEIEALRERAVQRGLASW